MFHATNFHSYVMIKNNAMDIIVQANALVMNNALMTGKFVLTQNALTVVHP